MVKGFITYSNLVNKNLKAKIVVIRRVHVNALFQLLLIHIRNDYDYFSARLLQT